MIVQAFYYDPCIPPNSIIIGTNEGLYLLRERGIIRLAETPTSLLSLNLRKRRRFFNINSKNHPGEEHLSELGNGYASEVDTIFFLKNGQPYNYCTEISVQVTCTMPRFALLNRLHYFFQP